MALTLAEASDNIGRAVVYRPYWDPRLRPEQGVITSVNGLFVFVRYGSDIGSKATNPDELSFLS